MVDDPLSCRGGKDVPREPSEDLDELAYRVIGAAIEVHRILGPGFLESVYENAMVVELGLRGMAGSTDLVPQSRGIFSWLTHQFQRPGVEGWDQARGPRMKPSSWHPRRLGGS